MANTISNAASNTLNDLTSGLGAQANELTYKAAQAAESTKQETVVNISDVNKAKEVGEGVVPGMNPNSANPYKAKVTGERPKNWNSAEGVYSDANLNDF
ncbi:hypothetical protein C7180_23690, partial [Salmonella enterica]|nr:hypothetical protein [Salmonella enterica]